MTNLQMCGSLAGIVLAYLIGFVRGVRKEQARTMGRLLEIRKALHSPDRSK